MSGEDATPTAPAAWWRQVFEVLDEALEVAPDERAAYLDRACGSDHAMGAAAAAVLAEAAARAAAGLVAANLVSMPGDERVLQAQRLADAATDAAKRAVAASAAR